MAGPMVRFCYSCKSREVLRQLTGTEVRIVDGFSAEIDIRMPVTPTVGMDVYVLGDVGPLRIENVMYWADGRLHGTLVAYLEDEEFETIAEVQEQRALLVSLGWSECIGDSPTFDVRP